MLIMKLIVDSREPYWVKEKFKDLSNEVNDLTVEITSLPAGDFKTNKFIIERKTLDDFISSFTSKTERKDGSEYERLPEQLDKLKHEDKALMKMFLIIGENYSDAFSEVNPHSINGVLAKLTALGFNVVMMSNSNDWIDYIYRLCRMYDKYTMPSDQRVLI